MAPRREENGVNSLPITPPTKRKLEILYEGYYYDVTSWVRRHPGGKIIEFYTKSGENATLPIQQFHNRSIRQVLGIMKALPKREAEKSDDSGSLSTHDLQRHAALTKDFVALHKELAEEGIFEPSWGHTLYRFAELFFLHTLGLWFFAQGTFFMKLIGCGITAMFGGRCSWLTHEAGHHSITGWPKIDRFLESALYGYGVGMSSVWWSSQHNRHHAMPQRLQHDVDLETLPLIAFNKRVVKNKKEGLGFFVQNQSILFALIDTLLVSFFWKLYLHPRYALKRGAYVDLFFMGLHYYYFVSLWGVWWYIAAVWMTSVYMMVNFTLSHSHLPVTDKPLHWVEYSLLHTVDIEPSWWCDWWMGYLNYQIEHHLFPTMPQFRGHRAKDRVKSLAEKHGIPYQCISYWTAMKTTFKNLHKVSSEIKGRIEEN